MVVALTHEPLSVAELAGCDAGDGAVCLFIGVVRNHNAGRAVTGLEYEAYEEMALPLMQAIAREARERFAVTDVHLIHRLGRLEIGEPSVVVSAAAPHRAAAFDACRYATDTLKEVVPIWKKDSAPDGAAGWVHPEEMRSAECGTPRMRNAECGTRSEDTTAGGAP